MALAIDGSTPAIATVTNNSTTTVTTASFTPPAGSLLLIGWMWNTQAGDNPSAPSITDNLGAHLTYNLLDHKTHATSPTANGQAASWWATVGTSAAMTVTVTSGAGTSLQGGGLSVIVFTGQDSTTQIGAHGKDGSTSAASIAQSYTASATGGWGVIFATDWDAQAAMTAGTGCTLVGSANDVQITHGVVRRTTADDSNGSSNTLNVTLPGTSTNLSWVYAEVLPVATSTQPQASYSQIWPPDLLMELITSLYQNWSNPNVTVVDQTINPLGITTQEQFGNPNIAQVISPLGATSQENFGTQLITLNISPTGLNTSESFGNPVVTLNLTPTGISSTENIGTAQVSQAILPTGIPSQEALGSPAVSFTLLPKGISSSEQFGTIQTTLTVSPVGIQSQETFGSPSIMNVSTISPYGISTQERLGIPGITLNIAPVGISPTETFSNPSVTPGAVTIVPVGINSQEVFGVTSVSIITTISPFGISTQERVGYTSTSYVVQPHGIQSSEQIGNASIIVSAVTIAPVGIKSIESFGEPSISLGLQVFPFSISSGEAFGISNIYRTANINVTVGVKVNTDITGRTVNSDVVSRTQNPSIQTTSVNADIAGKIIK